MHKCEIFLAAGSDYIDFSQHFTTRHLSLGYEHDEHTGHVFTAYSHHLDHISDHYELSNRIYSLEVLLNGARRISLRSIATMRIEFLVYNMNDVRGQYAIRSIDENPFASPTMPLATTSNSNPTRHSAGHYFDLAAKDDAVRTLLFLAGLIYKRSIQEIILTWGTLYKIYDTYKWMAGELGVDFESYEKTPGEISRFRIACNKMSIIGLSARHGLEKASKPPKDIPITDLDEAISITLQVAGRICKEYVDVKHQR
ncbi:hypothetical protein [Xanthomonas sp. WHRI 7065]|uniref:hypothetical protein n=1 Tax=Xanthomonas sp. WHRI 7065 TaxID=3161569 RepID=UPI0032E8B2D1